MSDITLASSALEALQARIVALEAENAVRKTIARYMALCDVPSGTLDGETLAALFTQDAIWEGIGPQYTQKFGHLRGHEAILAMLQRYLPPVPHFATNVHFLTSETIEVDGARAKGRWIMLQASGYVDARAELIAARLEIDFVPAQDGRNWLIQHFRTERLFDAPWQVNARKDTTT
ncbi:SnoaL-like domain-containing protein [Paraburkholderia steynii]|uniref:SnoaL-like domain-containing protein n=1 Tax=Paraburkholderia steynii TaxID=1245441 RepID=A0A7Z7AZK5_9BURK|nr:MULTISPECIES: nuclear transport factor 2 family protein [Paraburkholderia]BDC38186.1 polyketide cyclase [Paraburkholderia terrae]SDG88100.1 SnoaL-like domain-containing protein [Paraburkholderia steynii]